MYCYLNTTVQKCPKFSDTFLVDKQAVFGLATSLLINSAAGHEGFSHSLRTKMESFCVNEVRNSAERPKKRNPDVSEARENKFTSTRTACRIADEASGVIHMQSCGFSATTTASQTTGKGCDENILPKHSKTLQLTPAQSMNTNFRRAWILPRGQSPLACMHV